jgi:hypothetical protein
MARSLLASVAGFGAAGELKGARLVVKGPDGNDQLADRRADDGTTPRRTYVAPELVEYGTVAKLTQTGGQTAADSLQFKRMGSCL